MRAIAKRRILEWALKHSTARGDLFALHAKIEAADWKTMADIRQTFPSADLIGNRVVINVKGNHYRLIGMMWFGDSKFYYRWFGTHAEYSRLSKSDLETI